MIEQIYFNVVLYIIGYIFLFAGFSLSMPLRHIMAYFLGVALWVIVSTFLIIVSIPLNLVTVLSASAVVISLIVWFKKKDFVILKGSINKELLWFPIYLSFFVLINIAVFHLNLIHITPDSLHYMGVGLDIGRSGYYPPPGWSDLLIRDTTQHTVVYLTALKAGSYFFNIDFHHTIFPLSAVYFLLTFSLLFFIASEQFHLRRWLRLLLGICGALMIATVPAYLYHAYYVNQHLFTSIYFTICILSIFIYRKHRKCQWLAIAAITLSATVLQRTEMPIFAVIPIVMLVSTKDLKKNDYRLFLFIFLAISLPWTLFKLYYLGLGKHGHEWGLIQVAAYALYILSYLIVRFDITRKNIASIAPNIMISFLLIFIITALYYYNEGVVNSIGDLLRIISASKGVHNWGAIWLVIAIFTVINVSFIKQKDSYFWIKILTIFFSMRVIIYSLGFGLNQFSSGSRILIHIMPIGVFYIFFLLASLLSDAFSFKKNNALAFQTPRASEGK